MLPDERPNITRIVMVGCLSPSLMLLRMEKSSCTCGPSISRPCRVRDPTSFSVLGTRATSLVDVCGLACTLRDRGPCLHGSCDVAPRVSELFKKDCPRPGSNFHLRTPSPTNAKLFRETFLALHYLNVSTYNDVAVLLQLLALDASSSSTLTRANESLAIPLGRCIICWSF